MIPITIFSQTKITGQIVDQENNPLEYGEVHVMKDSIHGEFSLSDNYGNFSLNSENGKILFSIRCFGQELFSKHIVLNGDIDLGIIQVNNVSLFDEVTIVGKKKIIERKVDRMVFNAEHFNSSSGGDALDLLNLTPGLLVSSNQISILGKSSLSIMVNDRLIKLNGDDLINYLKTIRSEDIKRVEVITNPPSKYDAEGNGGLINIVLRKAANNSWSSSINSSYQQGKYAKQSLSGSYNYNKNNLSMNLNASYNVGETAGNEKSKIFYPNTTWRSENNDVYKTNLFNARVGIDYNVTDNWIIGVQYDGNYSKPNYDDRNIISIQDTKDKFAYISTNGVCERKKDLNMVNIHSIIKLDTNGRKVNIDIDYLSYGLNSDRDYKSRIYKSEIDEFINSISHANNSLTQDISMLSGQIDLEFPFKNFNLNYGGKMSQTKTNNDVKFFDKTSGESIIDVDQSNIFDYSETTEAIYISAAKSFSEEWDMKVGLRGEYTQTKGNSITSKKVNSEHYFEIFPTVYLTYKPTDRHTLSLDYGRRISRPEFDDLNPFRVNLSPYSYYEGNPHLKPVISTNVELNYTYNNCLQSAIYYSHTENNGGQVALLNKDTYIQAIVRKNFFDTDAIGFRQIYLMRAVDWWTSLNSVNLVYLKSRSKIFPITPKSMESFSVTFKSTNHFNLNADKTSLFGFDFQYSPAANTSYLVYSYDRINLNIFFKKYFLKKDLELTISGNNLLKEFSFNNRSERNGIKAFYSGYYDSQNFRLSVSYRFGSKKVSGIKRQGSNSAERGRTGF